MYTDRLAETLPEIKEALAAAEAKQAQLEDETRKVMDEAGRLRALVLAITQELKFKVPELPMTVAAPADGTPLPAVREPQPTQPRRNQSRDLIDKMVAGEPRRSWSLDDLVAEFKRNGWSDGMVNPREAIRVSAQRLVAEGRLRRTALDQYRRKRWLPG